MPEDSDDIKQTLTHQEKRVLKALLDLGETTPENVLENVELDELVEVMNAASWLQAKGLVRTTEEVRHAYKLDAEGHHCVEHKLPERRALDAITAAGGEMPMAELTQLESLEPHERGVAVGQLKTKGLIEIDQGTVRLTQGGREAADGALPEEPILEALSAGEAYREDLPAEGLDAFLERPHLYKKREVPIRRIQLTPKGEAIAEEPMDIVERQGQMTPAYLRTGAWRDKPLRPYDIKAFAPATYPGKQHPLRDIIERIREIYLQMGFTEISGQYARTALWNLDALFIPQDHPAREMQDTFYLHHPRRIPLEDPQVDAIRAVHEDGGETGSTGWGGTWSEEEASQVLLRTHTTVDTITHLSRHPDAP
ncbi:MAG: phenylalanine--tRNA ligase subunit alpha, partial [Candidatus Thermoplasmatota archaeon]|nr:phenylalanine--tRNA ligase subunit alpha [Candidatus Thermoplasmatota archaeon]